jgi:hypothetical protein
MGENLRILALKNSATIMVFNKNSSPISPQ